MKNTEHPNGYSVFLRKGDKKDIFEQVLTGVELNGHLA